jgi:outer membrane autotransporter protein
VRAVAALCGALILLALPVDGRAALNAKCSSCHNVPSDNAAMPMSPAIVNGAGSVAIIENAIRNQASMSSRLTLTNEPGKTQVSNTELLEIAQFLTGEVEPIAAGSVGFNSSTGKTIDLGAGSLVVLKTGAQLSNFNKLELVAKPSRGTVIVAEEPPPNSGKWTATYAVKANDFGADSFTYRAVGNLTSSERTVNITIEPPEKPTPENVSKTVDLNSAGVDIEVTVTGGFENTISSSIGPSSGMVWTDGKDRGSGKLTLSSPLVGTKAVFRYVPPRDGFGTETFSYTAVAKGGNAASGQIKITVEPLPATITAATLTVNLNTPTALDLKPFIGGSEISGVRIASAPAHGQAAINGTLLTYTPRHNYFGPDQLTWSAFGVLGESMMTSTVSVQVVGRPDPSQDPQVLGLVAAQTGAAQRLAWSQIENVQRRLERLHRPRAAPPGVAAPEPAPAPISAAPRRDGGAALAPALGLRSNAPNVPGAPKSAAPRDAPLALIGELAQVVQSRALDLGTAARLGFVPGIGSADGADAGLWIGGRTTLGRRTEQSGQSALHVEADNATLGFDRRFGPGLSLGLALGGTRERTTIGELGSLNRATGESLALYASWQPADRFFIDAMLGHGRLRMTSERAVEPIDDIARHSRRGRVSFGALAFGLEHELAPFVLAPYARFDVARHRLDETTDSGAGAYALRYLAQRGQHQRLALGLRVEAPHETDFGAATPWLRIEYLNELKAQASAQVAYADLPSGLYTLAPTSSDRHTLALGAGLELVTAKGAALALDYQMDTAAGKLRAQSLGLRWSQHWGSGLLPALPALPDPALDLTFDAGLTWDDNIARGKDARDRLADVIQRAGVSHDRVFDLAATTQAVLTFSLSAEALRRHSALSRASAEVLAQWRYRSSAAFGAPTTVAFASAAYDDWRSPLRDGARYALGASLRLPLTDSVSAAGTLAHNIRRARSAVFDLDDSSLRLNLDYQASERSLYYGSVEARSGDIVSSGRPSLDNLGLTERFVEDDAFGERDYLSYRFKARVGVLRLGANWRMGPASSLDLSWSRSVARPHDDLPVLDTPSYFAGQVRMVYLVRY